MEYAAVIEMSGDLRILLTRMHGTAKVLSKYSQSLEELYRKEGDELEAERDAWQSLDGVNWHERAKKAEAENERLRNDNGILKGYIDCIEGRMITLAEAIPKLESEANRADH